MMVDKLGLRKGILKKELLTLRSCTDLDGLHPNSGETPIRHKGTRSGRGSWVLPQLLAYKEEYL